jgi:GTP-binding protein
VFVDHVRIFAKAGDGGPGSSSFRRESFVPRGGPDGGDGGNGGSVILRADPHTDSLVSLFYDPHLRARDGGRGGGKKKHGKTSPDKIGLVPAGTLIYRLPPGQTLSGRPPLDVDAETDVRPPAEEIPVADLELVADLTRTGQEVVLCAGGKGGRGNVHFKNSRNQAPTRSDAGIPGGEGYFFLELRKIADAGLVGYPNAGKSTLLGRLSAARPKVAAYPFTTLHPLVGVLEFPGTYERATVADIPGLIEGAHRNVGLGHEFLRHIMRCRLLMYVLDMGGQEGRSPLEDLASLRRELSLYDPQLGERPWMVVANKMDLPEAAENLEIFRARFPKLTVVPISAAEGTGIEALRETLKARLAETAPDLSAPIAAAIERAPDCRATDPVARHGAIP